MESRHRLPANKYSCLLYADDCAQTFMLWRGMGTRTAGKTAAPVATRVSACAPPPLFLYDHVHADSALLTVHCCAIV